MPSLRVCAAVLLGILTLTPAAHAGLYYSGESIAELPSQWRGFLLDQRLLRNLAVKPAGSAKPSPGRTHYEGEAAKLDKLARQRQLTADETADLGAIYIRLGEVARAIEVLRPAQRDNPQHFRLAANLGTAWQLHGDLEQAAACLRVAVRLASGKYQKAEELHLKLVRLRLKEDKDARDLDDLFGVKYVGASGKYEPGKLAADQRKALPSDAAALVQQLALWLPADGRLLWQLAELAAVHGDVTTAAAILDGCVTEFNMRGDELRAHRQAMRTESDARAARADKANPAEHEGSAGPLKPKSSRPLITKLDQAPLPGIDPKGVNAMPWSVVTETTLDRHFKPTFTKYLKELDGKQVQLTGYMQPLGDDVECTAFMLIEYPVGCWYCEQPDMVGIVFVELPTDKSHSATRGQIRVTGKLVLNATDPENFLYTLRDAKVEEIE
jgi:hypothetical protein